MSILFGIRKNIGDVVAEEELQLLADATNRHAPDGMYLAVRGHIGMGFQPFHTHLRSNLGSQPVTDEFGNMLSFDGRLDNHAELREFLDSSDRETPDAAIVLKAFLRWGEECFSKLIGDWALALWSATSRSLYLARDHAGARSLYYEEMNDRVVWATYLDTFLVAGQTRELDREYAGRYLACQTLGSVTPYRGVRSVPPAHYLVLHEGGSILKPHWWSQGFGEIRYCRDEEYEEHFLSLFRQSVARRTGPGAAIIAQLSGGMDSSSIVCMSDRIRQENGVACEGLLDTISYYDDSEPNWDETPYFSAVESQRGKSGIHVLASFRQRTFQPIGVPQMASPLPGFDSSSLGREQELLARSNGHGYRVILSGMGGDELLGGVPTALPELTELLVRLRMRQLLSRSVQWCLAFREPLFLMGGNVVRSVLTLYGVFPDKVARLPDWITVKTDTTLHHARPSGRKLLGRSPLAIYNDRTWRKAIETLPHHHPEILHRYEYRYPYLDRDLVEFLFRIPRNQLVSPGERRSLMRRSLRGIVPNVVLDRRRKAYVIRAPLVNLQERHKAISELFKNSRLAKERVIDERGLQKELHAGYTGAGVTSWPVVMRAIALELWMQDSNVLCSR